MVCLQGSVKGVHHNKAALQGFRVAAGNHPQTTKQQVYACALQGLIQVRCDIRAVDDSAKLP